MVIVIVPLGTCERCIVPRCRVLGRFVCVVSGVGGLRRCVVLRRRVLGLFVCVVSGVGVRDGVLNVHEILAFGHGSFGVMC